MTHLLSYLGNKLTYSQKLKPLLMVVDGIHLILEHSCIRIRNGFISASLKEYMLMALNVTLQTIALNQAANK